MSYYCSCGRKGKNEFFKKKAMCSIIWIFDSLVNWKWINMSVLFQCGSDKIFSCIISTLHVVVADIDLYKVSTHCLVFSSFFMQLDKFTGLK